MVVTLCDYKVNLVMSANIPPCVDVYPYPYPYVQHIPLPLPLSSLYLCVTVCNCIPRGV